MLKKIKLLLKKNNNGMTLVEVLITIGIMSIMLVPIFNVFVETKEINHKTATTVAANFIGQKVLEDLKSEESLEVGTTSKTIDGYDITIKIKEISADLTFKPDGATISNGQGTIVPAADISVIYSHLKSGDVLLVEGIKRTFPSPDFELEFNPLDTGKISSKLIVGTGSSKTESSIKTIVMTGDEPAVVSLTVVGLILDGKVEAVSDTNFKITNNTNFKISVYEIDDVLNKVKLISQITTGNGEISTHQSKRSTAASGKNETKLFTIELEIRKNGTLYERLVSTAKK